MTATGISHDVLARLRTVGATNADIDLMLRDNPRRLFSAHGGY